MAEGLTTRSERSVTSDVVAAAGFATRVLSAGCEHGGVPVLLLHGGAWGETAATGWTGTVERLAQRRWVIAPDLLGFGGSAKVRDFTDPLGLLARQVAGLLTALDVATVDLVGLSMGGSVALHALTAEPPLLAARSLTLVSAGGPGIPPDVRARLGQWDGSVAGMREQVALAFADPRFAADDDFVTARVEAALQPGAYEAFASFGLRGPRPAAPPPPPDLARLRVPLLVVGGARDALKPPGWTSFADAVPGARVAIDPTSGHCPQIEAPEWFADVLDDFLAYQDQPQQPTTANGDD